MVVCARKIDTDAPDRYSTGTCFKCGLEVWVSPEALAYAGLTGATEAILYCGICAHLPAELQVRMEYDRDRDGP